MRSVMKWFSAVVVTTIACSVMAAEKLEYAAADDELKVVLIDKSEKESFLSVRLDTMGRIFVGGREALFVYEPKPDGSYQPKQELLRFPADTWVYDIAIRGHDLYVLTTTALYRVPGAVVQRDNLKVERLLWGVPMGHVHQCFHGLAWGPEGDLYISMGDPVWYYGDFNRPDHWGHWSFFVREEGVEVRSQKSEVSKKDNHDSLSRRDHVVKVIDDIKWQKIPYNGVGGVFRLKPDGTDFKIVARGLRNSCGLVFDSEWNLFTNDNDHEGMPALYVPGRLLHIVPGAYYSWPRGWLRSKTPDRADLLDTLNEKLGRFVPVGQSYYNDTFLPEKYRNNLLVARWCTRQVTRYPLVKSGATFKADEFPLLVGQNEARPVGVAVGRGGRIFVTVSYMAQNEGSPVYRSDLAMITRKDDPPEAPFEAYDAAKVADETLLDRLADSSWSRRYESWEELKRRDVRDSRLLEKPLVNTPELEKLKNFFLSKFMGPEEFAKHAWDCAASDDALVRHYGALELSKIATVFELNGLLHSGDAKRRLGVVLAAGFKLTIPPVDAEIPEHLKLDPLREESAYVIPYYDKKVDLRDYGRIGNYTVADHWKQSTHTPEQEALFKLLLTTLGDKDEPVRMQAAHFLSLLNDPRSEPSVQKVIAANELRRLVTVPLTNVLQAWVAGPFKDDGKGFDKQHEPELGPIDLNQSFTSKDSTNTKPITWQASTTKRKFELVPIFGSLDDSSVYAYFRVESATKNRAHFLVGSDDGIKMWHNGRLVWNNDVSRAALPYQDQVEVELQPGANDFLVRVRNHVGDSGLYVSYRALSPVTVSLPEKIATASLAERLAGSKGAYQVPGEFLNLDWVAESKQGDASNGAKLFEAIGCAKCHSVKAEANVVGGPSLADAGKRFTIAHLVESILLPSQQVSPVFRATQVVTNGGQQYIGLVTGETADKVEMLLQDAKRITIEKSEIDQREFQNLSPMPQGVVKKPPELRDLLAFLLKP